MRINLCLRPNCQAHSLFRLSANKTINQNLRPTQCAVTNSSWERNEHIKIFFGEIHSVCDVVFI